MLDRPRHGYGAILIRCFQGLETASSNSTLQTVSHLSRMAVGGNRSFTFSNEKRLSKAVVSICNLHGARSMGLSYPIALLTDLTS